MSVEVATVTSPRVTTRELLAGVARRSNVPLRTVNAVYDSLIRELTSAVQDGKSVVLHSFGRFYRQDHKGHRVRFGRHQVDPYPVLKFSASRSANRQLNAFLRGELASQEAEQIAVVRDRASMTPCLCCSSDQAPDDVDQEAIATP